MMPLRRGIARRYWASIWRLFCSLGEGAMERSAIFVNAGYLLAAGGSLICGTSSRAGFRCDYAGLTTKLADWAEQHSRGRFRCLRTYWYDGAPDGVARGDHELIGGLPYVKVRLGRLLHGEQKGVDALIYRDLMTLARERAINCAYLLSGDEDLREGVVAAAGMPPRRPTGRSRQPKPRLWGVPSRSNGSRRHLARTCGG